MKSKLKEEEEDDLDPCTGFPTTHKAKLSFPFIYWPRHGRSESINPSIDETDLQNENGDGKEQSDHHKHDHFVGILLTILSAIAFSFNALIIKMLSHLHPFNLGVWTFQSVTVLGVIAVVWEWNVRGNASIFKDLGQSENQIITIWILVRSFSGVSARIFFFYAVHYLTVADALVIDASSPIFVYLLAFLFLQENFGLVPLLTTILAIFGVALITRSPFLGGFAQDQAEYDLNSLVVFKIGVALAFSAMLCITVQIISLKFLGQVHYTILNCSFGLLGSIQCLAMSCLFGVLAVPTQFYDMIGILASATLFYAGQSFITLALQYEQAGPVGLARTTEVMFIFLWQFLFLGVSPDVYSCLGAILVLLGVTLIIVRKWITSLPTDSGWRKSCRLLLY